MGSVSYALKNLNRKDRDVHYKYIGGDLFSSSILFKQVFKGFFMNGN